MLADILAPRLTCPIQCSDWPCLFRRGLQSCTGLTGHPWQIDVKLGREGWCWRFWWDRRGCQWTCSCWAGHRARPPCSGSRRCRGLTGRALLSAPRRTRTCLKRPRIADWPGRRSGRNPWLMPLRRRRDVQRTKLKGAGCLSRGPEGAREQRELLEKIWTPAEKTGSAAVAGPLRWRAWWSREGRGGGRRRSASGGIDADDAEGCRDKFLSASW